jgi:predicted DNA-binding transcriptional regulator YafY
MPYKMDQDASHGVKLLRMFRKLMLDGRRHFQTELAEEFQCSPQTVIRMAGEIESVIGANLESGLDNRKRWYQIKTISRSRLGLDFEELRYLAVCRDLAASTLPEQVRQRVEATIFSLSMLMADRDYAERDQAQKRQFSFFSKGKIDYTPHFEHLEKLTQAAEERRICLVRYKSGGKSEVREYRFAPGRVVGMSGALYILGGDVSENFKEMRRMLSLAVHRIHDVILIERRFDFDLPEAEPGAFGLPWHEPRTFRIAFKPGKAADYVRERIWADEQKLEELEDGGVLLELTTRSEPELMAWVRSFGEEARLLC